jgi:hypothetical protein
MPGENTSCCVIISKTHQLTSVLSQAPASTHEPYLRKTTEGSRQSVDATEHTGADLLSMRLRSMTIKRENEDVISELEPWQSRDASVLGCSGNLRYWNEQVGVTDLTLKQAGELTAEQLTTAQEG